MRKGRRPPFSYDQRTVAAILESERWLSVVSVLGFSRREQEILESMLFGLDTEAQIADRLRMSPRTVQTHVQRLREKTSATSREQLLAAVVVACLTPSVAAEGK